MMRATVDWERYARAYDLVAENNPAYQSLLEEMVAGARRAELQDGACIADLGAGSGNLSVRLAQAFPRCQVIHVDASAEMNARAREKARDASLANHHVETCDAWAVPLRPAQLDLAVTMHALYTLPRPTEYLAQIRRWLRPGGVLVACDPGRVVDVLDWSLFLFCHAVHTKGFAGAVALLREGRVAAAENRHIAREQRRGRYWTHGLDEFRRAVEATGFEVLDSRETYRGVSDYVLARRAASEEDTVSLGFPVTRTNPSRSRS